MKLSYFATPTATLLLWNLVPREQKFGGARIRNP